MSGVSDAIPEITVNVSRERMRQALLIGRSPHRHIRVRTCGAIFQQ